MSIKIDFTVLNEQIEKLKKSIKKEAPLEDNLQSTGHTEAELKNCKSTLNEIDDLLDTLIGNTVTYLEDVKTNYEKIEEDYSKIGVEE